jgi:hypothetical protein
MDNPPSLTAPGREKRSSPKVARLIAAIATMRQRLATTIRSQPALAETPWAQGAEESLVRAEKIASQPRVDINGGWGSVHDAERLMVFGLSDSDLLGAAVAVEAEVRAKLGSWRASSMQTLFATPEIVTLLKTHATPSPAQRDILRSVIVQGLRTLHEDSDNRYHRLELVGRQLGILVMWLVPLMIVILLLSYKFGHDVFAIDKVLTVMIAGAMGGIVSAMFQLSRVGEAKIPEALMQGVITTGRPVVAAASALFIYTLMAGNVISLFSTTASSTPGLLVFAFVAGFSEQFVLGAVTKVIGSANDKKTSAKEK